MTLVLLTEGKIEHLFKTMTKRLDKDNQGYSPLNFQKKIIHAHLNEGKNVILHAPTGAGKTLAALSPFYISKYLSEEIDFPSQSIYVLPLRTLAYSLADEAKVISELWTVKTQTGEVQEDPFFLEGDVVFTTIDQALSGALTIPLSLPPRLANINAGVWPGSYLIFDEFHLLDPNRSLQTTIHLLKQLCVEMQLTRFTIMTATLSREIREILAKELNAVHIEVTDEDLSQIKSQFQKKRKVITHSRCLSAREIIEKHTSKTIVIVNQVDKATYLYKEVKRYQPKETEVFLLHSRLLTDERKSVERKLKKYFGEKRNKSKVILIATQVVEVGLDITSDVMLTEFSSAPSFLQRIGRNARFEGEEGIVHVYTLDDSGGNQPWLPYEEDEVKATEVYLQNVCDSYFDFKKSNDMINQLCSNKDKEIWQKIKLHQKTFKEIMADAYRGHDKGLSGKLIRNIESVSILIHGKPPRDERIYLHETISMPIGKMKGFVNNLIKRGAEFKVKIQRIVYEGKDISFKNIESVIDIRNFDYIIIHPSLASYEENVGLLFGTPCKDVTYSFPVKSDEKIIKRYIYKMDTFEEHINACLKAYKEVCYSRTAFTRKGFAELFRLTSEDINRIIDFIIVMHDAGKLSKDWQSKAMNTQLQANSNFNEKILLAHTDSSNGKRIGFPDHSVLGAVIAYGLFDIDEKYNNLGQSVLTAIAHHHSAIVEKLVWEGPLKGLATLQKLLSQIGWNIKTEDMKQHLTNQLKEAKYKKDWSNQWSYWHVDPHLYWMYLFLVRQLRISDQRSFEYVEIIRNDHTSLIVEEKKNEQLKY
ncbi:CRISPR-associated helicase Cas3/CRISPR-associated endonuclease Cas3-HD [Schinkia azotoformans MEV2011]|uniref:CRISPR-associated helicase Cas3/CRISPR-associated endonuclease Cas3-HD n=1 Tax=Schinkia azotoformans MEV2011 TaxID=1348973 RepID=A0A072NK07_SCHAZ|nr:CRISPR-associated helicase/endonuclease Cas3 [Schinkia azotoformans]KEF37801.1 CRISPR-associated helicase Cas3/CRISPR-associated endonuclease Cas3-HD [Schinkia azotoformans MEV2011]MEC1693921.1 CRISPR-associated helicase/endonuclease Cas3 [Schinkia azotoformans]MEC1716135.1 CRISPR-associated helicase/endonuclease Cas3 [Schinkia azotoformans]MEC1724734.1 CRISPR-associated helicase/endonuclease Cas3 [Schinkia azotoformans]MEC1740606.1 CRISPR-associated helicase/endonuclease Cas3 [Schinkia azo